MSKSSGTRKQTLRQWFQPRVQRLEDRVQPSANYYPPSNFQINPDHALVDARLGQQQTLDIALTYLKDHAADFGATTADFADPMVTRQYTDADSGITHLYLRQRINGLGVANTDMSVTILANGNVFSVGGGFVYDLANKINSQTVRPVIDSLQAVYFAAAELGLPLTTEPVFSTQAYGPVKSFMIEAPSLSLDDINAQLQYVPTADGAAVLAWELIIRTPGGQHWYDLSVNAATGETVFVSDWVDNDSYNALPTFTASPDDGGFVVMTNPADPLASPFGWHDNNGIAGPEFTDTRGNNVDAHLDRNADNAADVSPPRPSGGASLDFSGYAHEPTQAPTLLANQNIAQVQLFYANNFYHDVHYKYGFTEAAGNFQTNNYGKGGTGNDALMADAQDGSGTNNANFATPADGTSPRMQMYLYTLTTPNRDGDLDNGTTAHEFGHGVSNRLTAGSPNGLNALQSGGMGEGWGDFYDLMFKQRASDLPNEGLGHSTYTRGQTRSGSGNRTTRYSYDFAIDSHTFTDFGGVSTEVHYAGEIWCSALWDMNWLLIDKYGFDPNLLTGWTAAPGAGHAGNKLTLKLVMEGMKTHGANPSFIQARDAIIAADIALNGGADLFEIWSAFARRGLGQGASTASSAATSVSTSFTVPMLVASVVPATGDVVATHPVSYVLNVTSPINAGTLQASDFIVNGQAATGVSYTPGATTATFSFAVDPISAEGVQTITINAGAFTRASDGSAVAAHTSSFYYDATPLQVTSYTPAAGSTVSLPFTTLDVNFNQAINPSSVTNGDLYVNRGNVTGFTMLNADTTIRFTFADVTGEGPLNAVVAAGAVLDLQGNPNAAYSGNFTIDYTTFAFPTPLQPELPLGSLVYDGSFTANIGFAGDTDNFTLSLDAGQTLNVIVTPATSLRPSITVTGPGTNQTFSAGSTGALAQLQLITITTAGTYTFTVGGVASTIGNYAIQAVLNLANESESNGGTPNNTLGTAQDINASFINLGGGVSRSAIRGQTDVIATTEVESNGTIGTATLVSTASAVPTNLYQIGFSGNIGSGTDADYFNIGAMQVGDVLTISQSGSPSLRGTNTDPFVRLYRAGSGSIITSDDDSGPGFDALVYRYTITTADTYYVRGYRAAAANTGTYQIAVMLENTGTAPNTGATFTTEVEPNESTGGANNASSAWRPVAYQITSSGNISAGDTDIYRYQLTAGDVVTTLARATSTLSPAVALLDAGGGVLAQDDGSSSVAGAGGFAPLYGYVIPSTGNYYFRVTGASASTGSYLADVYLSTPVVFPVSSVGKDLYSMTLASGQSTSVALKNITTGNLDVTILDGGGAVVATGVVGATNVDELIANYTAPSAGTYYVQIIGPASVDYQFVVVTGGTFDAEANDSFATAQSLGGGRAALGAISGNDDWYQVTLAPGNIITVTTSTPGGGTGEFTNTLDPSIEIYDPSNVLLGSDDNSAVDGHNAVLTRTAAAAGNYRVRVRGAASTSGEYTVNVDVVTTPAPKVASYVIGDGTPQRSRVNSITVNFDQVVTTPVNVADAFQLTKQGGGSVTLSGVAVNSPNTTVTLTFTGGLVDFGSLADGRYDLTILSSMITSPGGQLDGDSNGTGGDNFTLIGSIANGLFRIFGDADGDGTVAANDFIEFRLALGGSNPMFDFDEDTAVATSDFIQFRLRFGGSI